MQVAYNGRDLRIALSAEDFDQLIRGRVVGTNEHSMQISVLLHDVGLKHMASSLKEAITDATTKVAEATKKA